MIFAGMTTTDHRTCTKAWRPVSFIARGTTPHRPRAPPSRRRDLKLGRQDWVAGLVTHGDGGHEGTSVGTRFRELEMRGYGDVRVADRVQRRLAGRGGDKRVVNEALQRHLDWMERSGTSFSGLPRSAWTVLPSDRFG